MDISIVIALYNEQESLPELVRWIKEVLSGHSYSYEIMLVDDGSNDHSWEVIEKLAKENTAIKAIKFRKNYGKSAALNEGFAAVSGEVVITMDADLQDSPEEIPALYKMIVEEDYDLVSGWKKKRYDPISKTIPSRFFNWVTRKISGIPIHDFNCGLKAYKKQVVKNIEVHGEMHRYMPLLARWAGFDKIGERVVQHQPRKYGKSKFGLERFINGFLDILSLTFITRFGKRPMHLFGLLGTLSFLLGLGTALYLAYGKFFLSEYKMTDRPLFYFGLLAMIIGTQLFLTGFIAEMVSRNSPDRNRYLVDKRIG